MTPADGALAGLRVVECGGMVAAPYAAKLMADLGADVVKVETPAGDAARRRGPYPPGLEEQPEASGLFLFLNTNKRGIVLDPDRPADRERFAALAAGADILVQNWTAAEAAAWGIDDAQLRAANPRLVHAWITPFGLSGPLAGWEADDLTLVAAGGWASISPGSSSRPDLPPLKAFGRQADLHAGLNAAIATLGALAARDTTGFGDFVEISAHECIVDILEMTLFHWIYAGRVPSRLGTRTLAPLQLMQAKDGLILIFVPDDNQWASFLHMLGDPEWGTWGVFADRLSRGANADVLRPLIEEWLADYTVTEVFEMAAKWRLPLAPVSSMGELVASPHLAERGFFVDVDHPIAGKVTMPGAPYLLGEGGWSLRRRAPLLGEHTAEVLAELGAGEPASGSAPLARVAPPPAHATQPRYPLEGIRVIDWTWAWAGPHCTLQLAHLGAEVIRLESYYRPCMNRRTPPFAGDVSGLNRAGSFNQNNQGKRGVVVDLRMEEGRALAQELVAGADILVENYAVGVPDRLGLGWETVSRINPRLVMLSLSGFGQTGPFAQRVAFGTPLTMLGGLGALSGYAGEWPSEVGISYGDPVGGLHGAFALLAALRLRARTGRGQYVDLSQWETLVMMLAEGVLPWTMRGEQLPRAGNRDILMAPHGVFRCAGEDEWVSIVVRDETEWGRFAAIVDPALAADPRFASRAARKANEDALDAAITAWTATRDRWAITTELQAAGLAAFAVANAREVAESEHLAARDFWVELPHAEVGRRRHGSAPWRYRTARSRVEKAAPCMGEDNEYVVRGILGRSQAEYERLLETGVLA